MTKAYIGKVTIIIHRFIAKVLDFLCADVRVREELWSTILYEALNTYVQSRNGSSYVFRLY